MGKLTPKQRRYLKKRKKEVLDEITQPVFGPRIALYALFEAICGIGLYLGQKWLKTKNKKKK